MADRVGSWWLDIGLNCLYWYWIASFAVADEGRGGEIGIIDSEACLCVCFVLCVIVDAAFSGDYRVPYLRGGRVPQSGVQGDELAFSLLHFRDLSTYSYLLTTMDYSPCRT